MGLVYLLCIVEENGETHHKIGVTRRNVNKRISELQTGNSNVISCLNQFESEHYLKIEKMLHVKYKTQRTSTANEWFVLTDEQVFQFVESCQCAEENIQFLLKENHFFN